MELNIGASEDELFEEKNNLKRANDDESATRSTRLPKCSANHKQNQTDDT